jgi:hypothetical protein
MESLFSPDVHTQVQFLIVFSLDQALVPKMVSHSFLHSFNSLSMDKEWNIIQPQKEESLPPAMIQMNMEDTVLSKISQIQKLSTTWPCLYLESKKAKFIEAESRIVDTKLLGRTGSGRRSNYQVGWCWSKDADFVIRKHWGYIIYSKKWWQKC